MSLLTRKLSWLTLRPAIRSSSTQLVIEEPWTSAILRAGVARRRVVIDTDRETVSLFTRTWWFPARAHFIPFGEISHLDYGYTSFGTSWGQTGLGTWGRHDEVEVFTVALVTQSGETYPLCRFAGEGAVVTGWMGTLLGEDDLLDLSGTQEEESLRFVDALSRLLKAPLTQPWDEGGLRDACPHCGRPTSKRQARCLYCGGALEGAGGEAEV